MNSTLMAVGKPALDQEPVREAQKSTGEVVELPANSTEGASPKTNRVQKLLREAGKDSEKENLLELTADISRKARSDTFECKELSIRASKTEGVAEIILKKSRNETLTLTVEMRPEETEAFCKQLCSSFESGEKRKGQITLRGKSFFKGAISASLVCAVLERSTVVGISGKGTWKPPDVAGKKKDPFEALRTLNHVEIGFEKQNGSLFFREVKLVEPSIGKYGKEQDSFLKDCDVILSEAEQAKLDGIKEKGASEKTTQAESALPSLDTAANANLPEDKVVTDAEREDPEETGGDAIANGSSSSEVSPSEREPVTTEPIVQKREKNTEPPVTPTTEKPFEALQKFYKTPIEDVPLTTTVLHSASETGPEKGSCTDVVLTTNQNNIKLSFTFKGNNLPAAGTGQQEADTRIDLNFKTSETEEHLSPELVEKIAAIVAARASESTIKSGVSLTELDILREISSEMESQRFSASNVFVANAFIDGGEELFKEATLGSSSLLEALYHPERAEQRPPIANSVIRNTSFKNIAATLENTVLEDLDMHSSHIHVVAKEDSAIRRISGVGAILSGKIDCSISGDFRRARLGTRELSLTGKAFEVQDGILRASALDKVSHFVVDLSGENSEKGGVPVIRINDKTVSLKELKGGARVEKLSALLENSHYHIRATINTTSDLRNAFSKQASLIFDEVERTVKDENGSVEAKLTFTGGDPDTGPLKVTAVVIVAAEPAPIAFSLNGRTGEALIYGLQRLSVLAADRTAILSTLNDVTRKAASQNTEVRSQAASDSQLKRGAGAVPHAFDEKVLTLGG